MLRYTIRHPIQFNSYSSIARGSNGILFEQLGSCRLPPSMTDLVLGGSDPPPSMTDLALGGR